MKPDYTGEELHAEFAQHRLFGEWFEPHPDILRFPLERFA